MIITVPLIVLMSITFVLVFLFVNTIDKRKWLTILVSIVLTPFIYFYAVYPLINIFSNYHHEKHFSSQVWQDKPALRYELSNDLVSSEMLIGKSKSEVESLLGTYEWLSWNDETKAHNPNKWNYGMGLEPGAFNTEKECLEITFNNQEVVDIKLYKEEEELLDAKE